MRNSRKTFAEEKQNLVALQNNSLIEVLCNRKYLISTIQIKGGNPIKLTKFIRESFTEFPQNFCGRKTKLTWVLRSVLAVLALPISKTEFIYISFRDLALALVHLIHPAY